MSSWVILVDNLKDVSNGDTPHKVMTVHEYLMHPKLFAGANPSILNLSRSYAYQGAGYYASLLAEARQHRVVPAVETMIELSRKQLYQHALPELEDKLNRCLRKMEAAEADGTTRMLVHLGQTGDPVLEPFARLLFDWFRAPVLEVVLEPGEWRSIKRIRVLAVDGLSAQERSLFLSAVETYTTRPWRAPKQRAVMKYSLAVLSDPKDDLPPSSIASLKHMAKVAARQGVEVVPIGRGDLDRLAQFDALFIRETTNIDNHTYRFARRAVQEGMPVIDDPVSMIRCTNKVYLTELLNSNGIVTPKTIVLSSLKEAGDLEERLGSPVVLKIPDGSFSRGVFRVAGTEPIRSKLKELFQESAILLAQEYCPTDFDWRIGVLDGEPLFACQYQMAKRHWQIVRHEPGKKSVEGGFTTVSLAETPPAVVDIAVRAARLIGDGFYGVDLKMIDDRVVVIEINDNPNLDHGVEDLAEKDTVWERLIRWFVRRLEVR
ncbi:RimK family protein [Roseibium marinum]|uniref:Glutathione synthase/RimK-type ligase-like ATP-grasp enzyme n=1 Tax=Roseibium marinum TaxID=281252 RepID=A0A2S3UV84_9HYPH|nr:RimK family protein [Roseibium marinum]POF31625.1 glutathione synthase/RimK-type ligase-like ATP-grasp enzyme [Roseibium marinum]